MWIYRAIDSRVDIVAWAEGHLMDPRNSDQPLALYYWQKTILRCNHGYKMVVHGRRAGATTCMMVSALYRAIVGAEVVNFIVPNNQMGLNVVKLFSNMASNLRVCDRFYPGGSTFINGGRIEFCTTMDDLIGRNPDVWCIDSADLMDIDRIASKMQMFSGDVWINTARPNGEYGNQLGSWAHDGSTPFRCGSDIDMCNCQHSPIWVDYTIGGSWGTPGICT